VIPRGKEAAALALYRFGFGPSFGAASAPFAISGIAGDPRGALLAELDHPKSGFLSTALPSSAQAARMVADFRAEEQAKRKLAQRAKTEDAPAVGTEPAKANFSPMAAGKPQENKGPPLPQRIFQDEAAARIDAAVSANIGFVERLVWFWSNHFCISADKEIAMTGAYEREAIRPHVLGRFGDLLLAAESHPAMLFYLDNVQSMGAGSIAGVNRDKGLNENLAREILELHTLGVRSGYSQADVTSFANVLTGWTWIDPNEPEHGGEFLFNKRLHQPGDKIVLGKRYADGGVEQGRAVLSDLARHPATRQHIAQKLARHFVADEPPPSLIAKLAKTFTDADGNLKEVCKALVMADESWTPQRSKLKRPSEWLVGVLRLTGAMPLASGDARPAGQQWPPVGRVLNFHAVLGEALWRPPAPNGYADTEAASIDGVPRRLDVANEFAAHLSPEADPLDLLDRSLGPLASTETRQTIGRAESRAQAFALLAMAPEYLRR
jgi:uncharacterized protein (DUF1800 family)